MTTEGGTAYGTFVGDGTKMAGTITWGWLVSGYFAKIKSPAVADYDEISSGTVYYGCDNYLLYHLDFFGMVSYADWTTKTNAPAQLGKYAATILESYPDAEIPY